MTFLELNNIIFGIKLNTLKLVWDGPIFFPVNDFFVKWQNREFIIKMPFVSLNNGCNVQDIQQGNVGDCWFLSSVMAVTNFGQEMIYNLYRLSFKWHRDQK